MFRVVRPMSSDLPSTPRGVVNRWAENLLRELATHPDAGVAIRSVATSGGLACLVLVWPVGEKMPTARGEQGKKSGGRERCRADILAVIQAAGRPLTRKVVVRTLKAAGAGHGAGTVAKALADLTSTGELVNHRDKKGYRMPGWIRPSPSLFDEL